MKKKNVFNFFKFQQWSSVPCPGSPWHLTALLAGMLTYECNLASCFVVGINIHKTETKVLNFHQIVIYIELEENKNWAKREYCTAVSLMNGNPWAIANLSVLQVTAPLSYHTHTQWASLQLLPVLKLFNKAQGVMKYLTNTTKEDLCTLV